MELYSDQCAHVCTAETPLEIIMGHVYSVNPFYESPYNGHVKVLQLANCQEWMEPNSGEHFKISVKVTPSKCIVLNLESIFKFLCSM